MLVLAESGQTGKIQAEVKVNASLLVILEVNRQGAFSEAQAVHCGPIFGVFADLCRRCKPQTGSLLP
jgi:hypothetical protein